MKKTLFFRNFLFFYTNKNALILNVQFGPWQLYVFTTTTAVKVSITPKSFLLALLPSIQINKLPSQSS